MKPEGESRNKRITVVLVALALISATQAGAGLCDLTFTDGGADIGSGQIDVESGYAVSGFLNVTTGVAAGLAWSLYTAGGPGATYQSLLISPAGAFTYDNAVFLDPNANPQYPGTSYLDHGGLLFRDGNNQEVNLWGDGSGAYCFYGTIGGNYNPAAADSVSVTLTPIPEPINYALAWFGLIYITISILPFAIAVVARINIASRMRSSNCSHPPATQS